MILKGEKTLMWDGEDNIYIEFSNLLLINAISFADKQIQFAARCKTFLGLFRSLSDSYVIIVLGRQ